MTELPLTIDATQTPDAVSKSAFAAELGVSKARVSQLVEKGLPLTPNGRVRRRAALEWYDQNIAPHRRKSMRNGPPTVTRRAELDELKIERERLALARDRAELVERAAVRLAVFERARSDRDALIAWASRVSAALASDLDADPGATFAALDRLVREHLAERAETPAEGLTDEL